MNIAKLLIRLALRCPLKKVLKKYIKTVLVYLTINKTQSVPLINPLLATSQS